MSLEQLKHAHQYRMEVSDVESSSDTGKHGQSKGVHTSSHHGGTPLRNAELSERGRGAGSQNGLVKSAASNRPRFSAGATALLQAASMSSPGRPLCWRQAGNEHHGQSRGRGPGHRARGGHSARPRALPRTGVPCRRGREAVRPSGVLLAWARCAERHGHPSGLSSGPLVVERASDGRANPTRESCTTVLEVEQAQPASPSGCPERREATSRGLAPAMGMRVSARVARLARAPCLPRRRHVSCIWGGRPRPLPGHSCRLPPCRVLRYTELRGGNRNTAPQR